LLFGYAQRVHERSGGKCQLCGAGSDHVDFDLWRQLTVEHLIGKSKGGYYPEIRIALTEKFPEAAKDEIDRIAHEINLANMISACSFCNSTTSRARSPKGMAKLIAESGATPEEVVRGVTQYLGEIWNKKRKTVLTKLESIREAFEEQVKPALIKARCVPLA
jgi:hypothetical protein